MPIAPISGELTAHEFFGDAMYQGYRQAEILPVAMMGPRQWFAKKVPSAQPLPFTGLQTWDEDNQPVTPGASGEIAPSASSMAG